ncbi:MAG: fatty acyl-AMP ligase [Myxococcales bacterium]|nr:fatty acyl-AMP ligase [Myxococcales bacterium]
MLGAKPTTLVEALATLPRGQERGHRFRSLDGSEHFYPWQDIERESHRRGALLRAQGLGSGDRLAIVVADPHHFVLSFVGAVIAGLVPVPIYPRASFKAKNAYVETVSHIVRAAGARALLTTAATKPVVEEVLAQDVGLEKVLVLEDFLEDSAPAIDFPVPAADDLCFLQFTSGSTSMPKGVMVTHGSLAANADAFLGPGGLDTHPEDVAVTWLPLFHDMGLIGFVLGTILRDIQTVLLPTEAFARRPSMWMQTMHEVRGTITFAPNFAYGLAAKRTRDRDLEDMDLSCIRVAGCGAEPINAQVLRSFAERFAPVGFNTRALMPAYGMAESTLAISFHPRGTELKTDIVDAARLSAGRAEPATSASADTSLEVVSCGVPFEGHELKILGDDGQALGPRQVGEVLSRGPSVTAGYYRNPEATAESFKHGWLHTGDLGYLADGTLYICGRAKDLIIIRGANHHPQDIEWAVSDVEGVRRDNVVAFSVPIEGEEQLVIAAEANSRDAAEVQKRIATRVAETLGLRVAKVAVVRVGSLPKTSSGKAQRRRTRALYLSGELEEHPT